MINITIQSVKRELKRLGVAEDLINMPAVIERIWENEVYSKDPTHYKIDNQGNIKCTIGEFIKTEDGEVEFFPSNRKNIKITIDEYGMDTKLDWIEKGKLISQAIRVKHSYSDDIKIMSQDEPDFRTVNGFFDWNLERMLELSDEMKRPKDLNSNEMIEYLIANYPLTQGWYVDRQILPQDEKERNIEVNEITRRFSYFSNQAPKHMSVWQREISGSNQEERELLQIQEDYEYDVYATEEEMLEEIDNMTRKLREKNESNCELEKKLARFILKRCGSIPFVGKKILQELHECVIPERDTYE